MSCFREMTRRNTMEILDLIDKLEDMTKNAKQPLLNKDQVIFDQDEIFDIVDAMRNNLPTAIQDAQWVKRDEERILTSAQDEHDRIIRDAKAHAQKMIEDHEITKQAELFGEDIVFKARQQAHEITEGAFMYAHDIMEKLENQLTVYYEVIQEGREDIQKSLESMQEHSYEKNFKESSDETIEN